MARDMLLGEWIIWRAKPRALVVPTAHKVAAIACFLLGAVALAFAALVGFVLDQTPSRLGVFALLSLSLGVLCLEFQKLWLAKVEYLITPTAVVVRRGPFSRSIERDSITFARILWSKNLPGVGDIELVRAVPAGVLHRRLVVRLLGVASPDKVWDIICGERVGVAANHRGDRSLGQRLDAGERVIWSEPAKSTKNPGWRELNVLTLGVVMLSVCAYMIANFVPLLRRLLSAGLADIPGALPALIAAEGLALVPILAFGIYLVYHALILPHRLLRNTFYLITDRRVLIQREREELHLNRGHVVDVIDTSPKKGLFNIFLVLDGPHARALATSGLLGDGEKGSRLKPVLEAVYDAEQVARILRPQRS